MRNPPCKLIRLHRQTTRPIITTGLCEAGKHAPVSGSTCTRCGAGSVATQERTGCTACSWNEAKDEESNECSTSGWFVPLFSVVGLALLICAGVAFRQLKTRAKVASNRAIKAEIMSKVHTERAENAEHKVASMEKELDEARELVKKAMSEGKLVMSSFELTSESIVYDEPRQQLGEGSFGTVFKAVFRGEHYVAVKTMRVSKVNKLELAKFKAEIVVSISQLVGVVGSRCLMCVSHTRTETTIALP